MIYRSKVRREDFHPDTQAFFAGRRVLVLGGSGFIGSHVVEMLLELGAHPLALTRSAAPEFLAHLGLDIEVIQGDLNDYATALAATRRASVVMNLAASVAGIEWNAAHPATMFMTNMSMYFNAIRAAAETGAERFLVTSSACVYPRHCSAPTPESEGFLDQPEPTNSGYGWAKRMEEFVGESAAREFGLSIAIARPYNAYGPRDDFDPKTSHVIPALIRKAVCATDGTFPVWGDGSHSRSFLYVDDFARGLVEVTARYARAKPLNIGTSEETPIHAVATLIGDTVGSMLGRSVQPTFNPQGLTGQPRRACDTTLAFAELGYEARVRLEDGLKSTVEWYLNHAHNALHSDA
jgi:GDP-L-fucose synthase